jgi:hypothetical protein
MRRTRDSVHLFSGNFNLLDNEYILLIRTLFTAKKTITIYSNFIQINAAFLLFTDNDSFERKLKWLGLEQ